MKNNFKGLHIILERKPEELLEKKKKKLFWILKFVDMIKIFINFFYFKILKLLIHYLETNLNQLLN